MSDSDAPFSHSQKPDEEARNRQKSAVVSGKKRWFSDMDRLSENVVFWQSSEEPDIGRHAKTDIGGCKRA